VSKVRTQTLLHLSSDHLTTAAFDWLDSFAIRGFPIAVVRIGEGLLIRLDDYETLAEPYLGCFASLDDATEYAHEVGASWLLLDSAGQKCADLTLFVEGT